jgi:hypothetical protein
VRVSSATVSSSAAVIIAAIAFEARAAERLGEDFRKLVGCHIPFLLDGKVHLVCAARENQAGRR